MWGCWQPWHHFPDAQGFLLPVLEAEPKAPMQESIFLPLPAQLPSLNKTSPASTRDRLITSAGSLNRLSLPPRARSQESLPAVHLDFPQNVWGWVGTASWEHPSPPGCPAPQQGWGYSAVGLSLEPKRGCACWYSSPVPPLCSELLLHCGGWHGVALLGPACLAGLCGEGRAEGTTKNTGGVRACLTGSWLVSRPTISPVTWCSVGCHAPVTHPALWKQVPSGPRGVQGLLYHPGLWEVLSGSAHLSNPVPHLLGIVFPVLVELVGVVCPRLGSISTAA